MNLGITFEEKILERISLNQYIGFIKDNKISFLEFAPDFKKYSFDFYKEIFNKIKNTNIQIAIHLPHFIDESLDISNYSKDKEKYFSQFYNKLNNLYDLNDNKITLVFHGAKYETITKKEALLKTESFIKFSLNYFNEMNYLINMSIETLNINHHKVVGDTRNDLINIVNKFNNKSLGICFDITHDYLNLKAIITPNIDFLNLVNHTHIHGFNMNSCHLPIHNNKMLFSTITLLKKNDYPINIELLICDNYLKELKEDIDLIQSL
ncbi:MAG: TIM barrel protein [Bacillota bacterium]|nr:TIM barrel protein [Bacillota bacterium]